jgi:hypothetical protein
MVKSARCRKKKWFFVLKCTKSSLSPKITASFPPCHAASSAGQHLTCVLGQTCACGSSTAATSSSCAAACKRCHGCAGLQLLRSQRNSVEISIFVSQLRSQNMDAKVCTSLHVLFKGSLLTATSSHLPCFISAKGYGNAVCSSR